MNTPSNKRRQLLATSAIALLGLTPVLASAQASAFPSRSITFVVPFAAGSATDQLARVLGQSLTNDTGQPVVENKRVPAA